MKGSILALLTFFLILLTSFAANSEAIDKIDNIDFISEKNFETNNNEIPFILPKMGGGMAHCDQQMSDCINMSIPEKNVDIVWHKGKTFGEKRGSKGLGFVSNGEIAAATFSGFYNNLIIYDYDGNILWKSGSHLNILACASAPLIDIHGRVIACDNKCILMVDVNDVDSDGVLLEWKSELIDGGLPISPVIIEDQAIVVATSNGPVYIFNIQDGSLIAKEYLNDVGSNSSGGYYETINTPCIDGNRVYISTQYSKDMKPASRRARLYALDIDIHSSDSNDIIKTAWYYNFTGPSGASPLFINKTIYFDGNKSLQKKPFTIALHDKGSYPELKWKAPIPKPIDASLSRDSRGGFWMVDALGGQLIHQSEEDGSFIEIINTDEIINEPGVHKPCSVITIYGDSKRPVLVTSALSLNIYDLSCYVIAINLSNNNSLMWKVKLSDGMFPLIDFPFGQYPVLIKDGKPRIVFTSMRNGAWAIGSLDDVELDLVSRNLNQMGAKMFFYKLYHNVRYN